MSDTAAIPDRQRRGNWIRLRTMILLRWIAVSGQIVAITVAQRSYNLQLEVGLCYLAIGAAIVANLVAIFVYPENKRLNEGELSVNLLFDMGQLSFLLYLTGGLHNPFALLILVSVTVAATTLQLRSSLILGAVAIILTTLLAFYYQPLRTEQGFILRMPQVFIFGFWGAIVIGVAFLGV